MRKEIQKRDRWDIERDVRTLKEAKEIKNDSARLKDAQNMIRETRSAENDILNMKPTGTSTRRSNPATIGALNVPQ